MERHVVENILILSHLLLIFTAWMQKDKIAKSLYVYVIGAFYAQLFEIWLVRIGQSNEIVTALYVPFELITVGAFLKSKKMGRLHHEVIFMGLLAYALILALGRDISSTLIINAIILVGLISFDLGTQKQRAYKTIILTGFLLYYSASLLSFYVLLSGGSATAMYQHAWACTARNLILIIGIWKWK